MVQQNELQIVIKQTQKPLFILFPSGVEDFVGCIRDFTQRHEYHFPRLFVVPYESYRTQFQF